MSSSVFGVRSVDVEDPKLIEGKGLVSEDVVDLGAKLDRVVAFDPGQVVEDLRRASRTGSSAGS
jgi:hypothetical protein